MTDTLLTGIPIAILLVGYFIFRGRSRDLVLGALLSYAMLYCVAWLPEYIKHPPKAKPKEDVETVQLIEMPKIPPPDDQIIDDTQQQQKPADFAPPMQNDVPVMVAQTPFVQRLEPPPPPNLNMKATTIIPQNTGSWANGIGKVFDINQLDQQPQATVQVRPQYPFEMRRAGISGSVLVDFIVDTEGNVHNAYAAQSSQREFESSAVQAVSKWRFRPGRRDGHAVNVHMQVPIVFTLNNDNS